MPAISAPEAHDPVEAWRSHLERRLEGPAPVYRRAVARVETAWALSRFEAAPPAFDLRTRNEVVAVLGAASAQAADDLLGDVASSSSSYASIYEVAGAVREPVVTLRPGGGRGSRPNTSAPVAASTGEASTVAASTAPLLTPAITPTRLRPVQPFVRAGYNLRVRGPEEVVDVPLADASVYLRGHGLGVTDWRLSSLAMSQQWHGMAQQRLIEGLYVTGSAQSNWRPRLPLVRSVGLLTPLSEDLRYRLQARVTEWEPTEERAAERRAMVVFSAHLGGKLPWVTRPTRSVEQDGEAGQRAVALAEF